MAEALVQTRPTPLDRDGAGGSVVPPTSAITLSLVAQRLAELTQCVLGCRRVSIAALDAATGHLYPVTQVSLSPDEQPGWWASWSPPQRLEERYGSAVASLLYAGTSTLLDPMQLPESSRSSRLEVHSGRIVPMRLGEVLVGVLLVEDAEPDHAASEEEQALMGMLARLGALVLERDQLLRGWVQIRASELALAETKAQMDAFLSIASHELKTPLTSLKLSLQLTLRRLVALTQAPPSTSPIAGQAARLQAAVEQLGRTARQMERLERLANDLVDGSRIQAGQLELRLAPTDLVGLVTEAVEVQQQAHPELSIRLVRRVRGDDELEVEMDGGRIEQVVTNFLTNALAYSPADRPVEVGIEVVEAQRGAGQQARVWVRDEGPGVPLEEQEQIWERFHRVREVEGQTGVGLGLYIAQMVVQRHQGQVGVESVSGQGATFWFTLPVCASEQTSGASRT